MLELMAPFGVKRTYSGTSRLRHTLDGTYYGRHTIYYSDFDFHQNHLQTHNLARFGVDSGLWVPSVLSLGTLGFLSLPPLCGSELAVFANLEPDLVPLLSLCVLQTFLASGLGCTLP